MSAHLRPTLKLTHHLFLEGAQWPFRNVCKYILNLIRSVSYWKEWSKDNARFVLLGEKITFKHAKVLPCDCESRGCMTRKLYGNGLYFLSLFCLKQYIFWNLYFVPYLTTKYWYGVLKDKLNLSHRIIRHAVCHPQHTLTPSARGDPN